MPLMAPRDEMLVCETKKNFSKQVGDRVSEEALVQKDNVKAKPGRISTTL